MKRRTFNQTLAFSAAPLFLSSLAQAAESEPRWRVGILERTTAIPVRLPN
jgi:hypothetical protein